MTEHNYSQLEHVIAQLSALLGPVQKQQQVHHQQTQWPTILIVGAPRSGTTLMLQWLASLGLFAYPSNVLNRFAYAPHIGALVQRMLFEQQCDPSGDFTDLRSTVNFNSDLGKSRGALATCEFQHFFRQYIHHYMPTHLSKEEVAAVDWQGMCQGLFSIQDVFEKPFVTKAMMAQFNLASLCRYLKSAVIIHCHRSVKHNMQSILLAREQYHGCREQWWSVKPKQYQQLATMDYFHQVAGQVFYTNRSIRAQLGQLSHALDIDYDEFCQAPESLYQQLRQTLASLDYQIPEQYSGVKQFHAKQKQVLSDTDMSRLLNAYQFHCRANDCNPVVGSNVL
ncbi:sulfotransferase [Neiella sp. HB171785]|uniref:Sulfotransferase n=1 Tax=Neiella litorisoli TaxID=2771431 RepID=A0A8J6QRZ1_9GAMM|nr:sulfotransferase [Neiella litorisoli]MBD1390846.1 sulfotransferase [Neiella litorisoli]